MKTPFNESPAADQLLGHKRLETTLAYYAEIDEDLALHRWSNYLADQKTRKPERLKKKRKAE